MYRLSTLPTEILYTIMEHLTSEEILLMARLNTWYSYHLSWVLSERIERHVRQDGWRIHIDVLAKTYVQKAEITSSSGDSNSSSSSDISESISNINNGSNGSSIPSYMRTTSFEQLDITSTNFNPTFTKELLLLSEYSGKINPYTLTLEFELYPVAENGLDTVLQSTQCERSIAFINAEDGKEEDVQPFHLKANIDMVAFFAQISTNSRRLQHINQAGATAIVLRNGKRKAFADHKIATMGKGLNIQYKMCDVSDCKNSGNDLIQTSHPCVSDKSAKFISVISFDKLYVSPEWWFRQMKIPALNSNSSDFDSCAFTADFF